MSFGRFRARRGVFPFLLLVLRLNEGEEVVSEFAVRKLRGHGGGRRTREERVERR